MTVLTKKTVRMPNRNMFQTMDDYSERDFARRSGQPLTGQRNVFENNNGRENLRDNFDQDYRSNGNARVQHRNVFRSTGDWGERDFVIRPMKKRNAFPNNNGRAYYRDILTKTTYIMVMRGYLTEVFLNRWTA